MRASRGDRHTYPPVTVLGTRGVGQLPWARTRAWQVVPWGPGEPHRGEAVVVEKYKSEPQLNITALP